MAHAVYQPQQRHPVQVPAAQQEHLVQWLSKRLGRPLKVPVLTAQGYELVGGRLLPGDTGARAQFMYQNSAGERVTLYLGALPPTATTKASPAAAGSAAPPPPADTAFRFTQEGPVPGFYWTDQGFGYALSGQLSRPALQALATAVYQQL
jgi:anti-sigma factor RsiW